VPALIECLQDEPNRQFAIHALGRIGPGAKAAAPALMQMLKDEVYYIRAGAAEALGRVGCDAKSAVAELVKALNDDNAHVRRHAAEALDRIDPKR
jgi:HEAT repeat protein